MEAGSVKDPGGPGGEVEGQVFRSRAEAHCGRLKLLCNGLVPRFEAQVSSNYLNPKDPPRTECPQEDGAGRCASSTVSMVRDVASTVGTAAG
jgi:hypothetical protein